MVCCFDHVSPSRTWTSEPSERNTRPAESSKALRAKTPVSCQSCAIEELGGLRAAVSRVDPQPALAVTQKQDLIVVELLDLLSNTLGRPPLGCAKPRPTGVVDVDPAHVGKRLPVDFTDLKGIVRGPRHGAKEKTREQSEDKRPPRNICFYDPFHRYLL